MNDIDLNALEATARAAAPGPWDRATSATRDWALVLSASGTADEYRVSQSADDDDAEHIATFDPTTALALIARLREAETVIGAIDAIEPMWPRGMYGCPQDMIGRNQIRPILARYKTTKTEGSER
jgi:hypothetical protein